MSQENEINYLIESLARIILQSDSIPQQLLTKSLRILRFKSTTSTSILQQHGKVLKQRIHEKILGDTSTSSSTATKVTQFKQECDILQRRNRNIVVPILSFFEPLSFQSPMTKSILSNVITKSNQFDHETSQQPKQPQIIMKLKI